MAYNPAYTKFVKFSRLLLPVIAVVLLATVIFWQSFEAPVITPIETTKFDPQNSKNEVLVPEFDSTDENGNPYKFRADSAVQNDAETGIFLKNPSGTYAYQTTANIDMISDKGTIWREQKRISLEGNVILSYGATDNIYKINTDTIFANMNEGVITSPNLVTGTGKGIKISAAGGLTADAHNEIVIFKGPVNALLETQDLSLGQF